MSSRYLETAFATAVIGEDRQVRSVVPCAKTISDIVKRECGRWGRESVCPGGHVRQAYGGGSGNGSATGLFVTVCVLIGQPYGCRISDGHRSRERSSALRAFGGCLGAERR
jgi:hypothetical protein